MMNHIERSKEFVRRRGALRFADPSLGDDIPHVSTLVRGRSPDLREMLVALDTPASTVTMAVQFAFFSPSTTDPYAPGVIELVRAAQRGLRKLGAPVVVNGVLGEETGSYLKAVSGPLWHQKAWVQVLGDVLLAIKDHKSFRRPAKSALAGDEESPSASPIVAIVGVSIAALLYMWKKR